MPESRGWVGSGAGFLPAAGRFAGGCGGVGLLRAAFAVPFELGGGGGALGAGAGAGGGADACSSTYAAGTHACPPTCLASHQPVNLQLAWVMKGNSCGDWLSAYHCSPFAQSR